MPPLTTQNGGETKRTPQSPKRLLNEYLAVEFKKKYRTKSARDIKIHEIEIVAIDKQKKKAKIHYKGYSEEPDEWRDYQDENMFLFERLEKTYIPGEISLEDRTSVFHGHVLWSRRRDDPDIRIEAIVDPDGFKMRLFTSTLCALESSKIFFTTDATGESLPSPSSLLFSFDMV